MTWVYGTDLWKSDETNDSLMEWGYSLERDKPTEEWERDTLAFGDLGYVA